MAIKKIDFTLLDDPSFVILQHTKCGYISNKKLICIDCNSLLYYLSNDTVECTFCKVKRKWRGSVGCDGCMTNPIPLNEIKFIPQK